ncbi:hypothetical protein BT96DRAFT_537769 [Gymnopus androsaceus JB14]|uniref:Uncharacterized protein n=1 Tax=Gymnopus androsaceus JB14 TaxID=1447944 RepID=A0A6A4HU20_9AGAR|nr:hypothetical protein BT96DRAFT_537769 [Gymnopus androsaceus JB14]
MSLHLQRFTASTLSFPTMERDENSSTRELLDGLKSQIKDVREEYRHTLEDIHQMTERALIRAESELGDSSSNSVALRKNDGVLVQTFIPLMRQVLQQTIKCIEVNASALNSLSVQCRPLTRSKKNQNQNTGKELIKLRFNMEELYSIAMPPSESFSTRTDNALVIAASIGNTLSVLCDSTPVLGPLKVVAAALSEVCSTVQTLRSNSELAADILQGVRAYFHMVVRKVQKYPAAQEDEELHQDVAELLKNLLCVQETLLKLKHQNQVGSRGFFAQKDKEGLEALRIQVQESRSMFEVSLYLMHFPRYTMNR